jgi:peptide/nickel transport system substrate-binding protein
MQSILKTKIKAIQSWQLLLVFVWFLSTGAGWCQEDKKPLGTKVREASDLVDQEPYDLIILDDFNENAEIHVVPLAEIPTKPFPENGNLLFNLMDGSWPTLQVPWENVADFKTFNQMLSEEADQRIASGDYAHAFRNLLYILDHSDPGTLRVEDRIQKVLFLDGKANYDSANYAMALSIFEDLYRRNPRFQVAGIPLTAIDLILDCYDRSLNQFLEKDEFDAIRSLLATLSDQYQADGQPLITKWNDKLDALAAEFLSNARQHLRAGNARDARAQARRAINVNSKLEAAYELFDEVIKTNPTVFVGVSQPALNPNPNRIEDWSSRRVGRLTQRRLVELVGLSEEGGRYEFINGRFVQIDQTGYKYRFQIDPSPKSFAVPKIESYELASLLLRQADPENPKHVNAWAKILKTVSVTGQYSVEIELKVPYVRPEALMNFAFKEFSSNAEDKTGPYILGEQTDSVNSFTLNPTYERNSDNQYPQISEWLFPNPSDASDALRRGMVDAVDRIPPSDLSRLRQDPQIEVRPYLIPTIHMLVPNFRNDFLKQATFRSGLLKSINREQILNNMLCNGVQIDGTMVIDGPFPIGSDSNQQIAYGYNTRVTPVRYAQLIGAVLLEATRLTQETKLVEAGAKDPQVKMPTLILAHPKGDVPAIACRAIAGMWEIAGVKTELRELPPGVTIPEDDNYDLLYCELTMAEPLTDANFLFGTSGIVKNLSAPVEQMMRAVNVSNSWRAASGNLRQLHRQVLNDVTVIPLWQMTEHYAFRRNVREIGRDLMFLYQFVDRWQIGPIRSLE